MFKKCAIFLKRTFLKIARFNAIKRTIDASRSTSIMAANTLGEFSDGEDDFVWQTDENLWEWNNTEDDDLIRNIDENDILGERNEPIHTGRGEKRKSDEPLLPENDFYHIESVKNIILKNFV